MTINFVWCLKNQPKKVKEKSTKTDVEKTFTISRFRRLLSFSFGRLSPRLLRRFVARKPIHAIGLIGSAFFIVNFGILISFGWWQAGETGLAAFLRTLTTDPCQLLDLDHQSGDVIEGKFPEGFLWGVSSAAYSIEGGWNADGKGESIWDRFVSNTSTTKIRGGGTGRVAADSYNQWPEDVKLLKKLQVNSYRLSISWPRIIPTGHVTDGFSTAGVRYYRQLLSALDAADITPIVTVYHWDMPQRLEDAGGWRNPMSSEWYRSFASQCFQHFGPYVKYWITFEQPLTTVSYGHGNGGRFAPGIVNNCTGDCPYIVAHNQLRAHAYAFQVFDKIIRKQYNSSSRIGITLNGDYLIPATRFYRDRAAAQRGMEFSWGWFANPIFSKNGGYPSVMKEILRTHTTGTNGSSSLLPKFTKLELKMLKGSCDFLVVNFHQIKVASQRPFSSRRQNPATSLYQDDAHVFTKTCPELSMAGHHRNPWGMLETLKWIQNEYRTTVPPIIVAENGHSDPAGSEGRGLFDRWRVDWYRQYLSSLLKAMSIHGINVRGFLTRSFLDGFEWTDGYTKKFGMVYIDYRNRTETNKRTRKTKLSFNYYRQIIQHHGFSRYLASDLAVKQARFSGDTDPDSIRFKSPV